MLAPLLLVLIVAAPVSTVAPRSSVAIPVAIGDVAVDVSWDSGDALVLATNQGVYRYALSNAKTERLVSAAQLPDGLPDPESVASDGTTLAATSHLSVGGYLMRLADRKRLKAQRGRFAPFDVAVRGKRICLLAFPFPQKTNEAAWCGVAGEGWSTYKPVHRLSSGVDIFRDGFAHLGGAIALANDGSLFVITSAEPGVFRYAPDDKLIERSGRSFDELVLPMMRAMRTRFATDMNGRYHLVLNKQPIVEDLVVTPRGPAIVVRIAEKDRIRWELWWPRADGRSVLPTRLGIDRIGPFGHLRCDARGNQLACVGSLPDRKKAADFRVSERVPRLWIFELPK